MKKINNYWVDKNNNRWDASNHTKKQAQAESKSLVNCSNCINCSYCSDCSDLVAARHNLAGSGSQTADLCMGGYNSAVAERKGRKIIQKT